MPSTFWVDTLISNTLAADAQDVFSLMTGVSTAETRNWTLLRTIILLDLAATVHDASEGDSRVDIGIGITSQEAFAAGVVPDPNVGTDKPTRGWIFRGRYRYYQFAAGVNDVYSVHVDKDIRSRRKLENGEAYLNWVNTSINGVAVARLVGLIRMLWLIP